MIQVNKEEAKKIREIYPEVAVKRTVHKYYVEDTANIRRLIGRSSPGKGVHHS